MYRYLRKITVLWLLSITPARAECPPDVQAVLEEAAREVDKVGAPEQQIPLLLELADVFGRCPAREKRTALLARSATAIPPVEARDSERHGLLVMALMNRYAADGSVAQAERFLAEIEDADWRISVRAVLADQLMEHGRLEAAESVIRGIADEQVRQREYFGLADLYARRNDIKEAQRILELISDSDLRNVGELLVAIALSEVGEAEGALAFTEKIADPTFKVRALCELAQDSLTRGDRQPAEVAYGQAKTIADNNNIELSALFIVRGMLGDMPGAMQGLQTLNDQEGNWSGSALARSLIEIGNFEGAEAAIRTLKDPFYHADGLRELCEAQAAEGQITAALKTARSIEVPSIRSPALLAVARRQVRDQEAAAARTTIDEALAAVRQVDPGGGTELLLLFDCAEAQVEAGDLDGAELTFTAYEKGIELYPDAEYRGSFLQDVYAARARAGQEQSALNSAREYELPMIRACCLIGIGNGLLDAARDGR